MGFPSADSSIAFVLANNAVNMLATLPAMWLVFPYYIVILPIVILWYQIEKSGRKNLFIWGGAAMAVAHYMITVFVGASEHGHPKLAWGGMVFIFVFIIAFASTWGPGESLLGNSLIVY